MSTTVSFVEFAAVS